MTVLIVIAVLLLVFVAAPFIVLEWMWRAMGGEPWIFTRWK